MENEFSYLLEKQKPCHCGAASLSYCLYVLGVEKTQSAVAKDAGSPYLIYWRGLGDEHIRKAAEKNNAVCKTLETADADVFHDRLAAHLKKGNPAILAVEDCSHWVAAIGGIEDKGRFKFVVDDPIDKEKFFFVMNKSDFLGYAWNDEDSDGGEYARYYAILISRRDGKPGVWKPTKEFLDLCEKGSYATALEMAGDLGEIVASSGGKTRKKIPLAEIMAMEKDTVRKSLRWLDWNSAAEDMDAMMEFYGDYRIVADSAGIECPADASRVALVSQITALLVTCAWTGTL